jgi:predicted ArsR family transcriptional regulator
MLEKLLRLLSEGGAHSLAELARALGVSEELLRPMIADLVRLGYLHPVAAGCQGNCAECPLLRRSPGGCEHLWALTAKGKEAGLSEQPG